MQQRLHLVTGTQILNANVAACGGDTGTRGKAGNCQAECRGVAKDRRVGARNLNVEHPIGVSRWRAGELDGGGIEVEPRRQSRSVRQCRCVGNLAGAVVGIAEGADLIAVNQR